MKILLIDNFHYRRGGAEVVYLNTADVLKSHGHNVIYFSQSWSQNIECEYQRYFPDGIDIRNASFKDKIKAICSYFYNRKASQKLEKLIRDTRPDIAHIHLFWGGLSTSVLPVLKKHSIPVVHTVHDYRMVCPGYTFKDGKGNICEKCNYGKYFNCINKRCAKGNLIMSIIMTVEMYFRNILFHPTKYISTFIFVSNFSKDRHILHDRHFLKSRNEVVYNFSNEDVLSAGKNIKERHVTEQKPYYLYYGRLSFEKGIQTLITAFSQHKDLTLKIVGQGPLENKLRTLCSKLDLANIEFLGFKTGKELYNIVKNAKFVCVPSEWYENNPMTIIEAYTLSTPVIGAAIGGITEIVQDKITGFLFESSNISSLSESITRAESLSLVKYLEMKKNARIFAEKNFGKEQYYDKLVKIYDTTLKNYKR